MASCLWQELLLTASHTDVPDERKYRVRKVKLVRGNLVVFEMTWVEEMRRQGMMRIPARDVSSAPVLKLILPGARLTRALAGATIFAAMLVESVATSRPASTFNLSTAETKK